MRLIEGLIGVRDIVDIYFEHIDGEVGVEVLSTPAATGDCFKVQREDGTMVNVQTYSKMVKVGNTNDSPRSYHKHIAETTVIEQPVEGVSDER